MVPAGARVEPGSDCALRSAAWITGDRLLRHKPFGKESWVSKPAHSSGSHLVQVSSPLHKFRESLEEREPSTKQQVSNKSKIQVVQGWIWTTVWSGTQLYFVISFVLQVVVFFATALLTLYPTQRERFATFMRRAAKYISKWVTRMHNREKAGVTGNAAQSAEMRNPRIEGARDVQNRRTNKAESHAGMQKSPSVQHSGTRRRLTVHAQSSGSFFPDGKQPLGSLSPQPQSHLLYNDDPAAAVVATKLKSRYKKGSSRLPGLTGLGDGKSQRVPLSRSISRTNCNALGCHVKFQYFGLDKHHCKYCNGVFCSQHTAYISHSFYRRCDIDSQCVCPNCLPLKRKEEKRRFKKMKR